MGTTVVRARRNMNARGCSIGLDAIKAPLIITKTDTHQRVDELTRFAKFQESWPTSP